MFSRFYANFFTHSINYANAYFFSRMEKHTCIGVFAEREKSALSLSWCFKFLLEAFFLSIVGCFGLFLGFRLFFHIFTFFGFSFFWLFWFMWILGFDFFLRLLFNFFFLLLLLLRLFLYFWGLGLEHKLLWCPW